jgi:hypothetical protein
MKLGQFNWKTTFTYGNVIKLSGGGARTDSLFLMEAKAQHSTAEYGRREHQMVLPCRQDFKKSQAKLAIIEILDELTS